MYAFCTQIVSKLVGAMVKLPVAQPLILENQSLPIGSTLNLLFKQVVKALIKPEVFFGLIETLDDGLPFRLCQYEFCCLVFQIPSYGCHPM